LQIITENGLVVCSFAFHGKTCRFEWESTTCPGTRIAVGFMRRSGSSKADVYKLAANDVEFDIEPETPDLINSVKDSLLGDGVARTAYSDVCANNNQQQARGSAGIILGSEVASQAVHASGLTMAGLSPIVGELTLSRSPPLPPHPVASAAGSAAECDSAAACLNVQEGKHPRDLKLTSKQLSVLEGKQLPLEIYNMVDKFLDFRDKVNGVSSGVADRCSRCASLVSDKAVGPSSESHIAAIYRPPPAPTMRLLGIQLVALQYAVLPSDIYGALSQFLDHDELQNFEKCRLVGGADVRGGRTYV
jgi:hypothetical protein